MQASSAANPLPVNFMCYCCSRHTPAPSPAHPASSAATTAGSCAPNRAASTSAAGSPCHPRQRCPCVPAGQPAGRPASRQNHATAAVAAAAAVPARGCRIAASPRPAAAAGCTGPRRAEPVLYACTRSAATAAVAAHRGAGGRPADAADEAAARWKVTERASEQQPPAMLRLQVLVDVPKCMADLL